MADEYQYQRIIGAAARVPWALSPQKLYVLQDLLRLRAAGVRFTPEELRARISDDDERAPAPSKSRVTDGYIAVIPVYGVIAPRTFEASSGMTSTEGIARAFRSALNDSRVSAIVFDHSSPGGATPGLKELAAEMRAARGEKPIVAIANQRMFSASYWLAAAADEIVMTPSGEVGSIGVWSLHEDITGMLEKEGIVLTAFSAGDKKLEGAPWIPLDDDARAHFQSQVDAVYADFLNDVAKGRGITVAEVKKAYGQGRTFLAKDAKTRGMVDRVETFEALLTRLSAKKRASSTASITAGPAATAPSAADAEDDGVCADCNGSGLKPERFMSDPQGQESCETCGGTGKRAAPATSESQAGPDQAELKERGRVLRKWDLDLELEAPLTAQR